MYEYGSRAGVWRILDLFSARDLPLTAFAVGRALELNPRDRARPAAMPGMRSPGMATAGWITASIPEDEERQHIRRTIEVIEQALRTPPGGLVHRDGSATTRADCCAKKAASSTTRTPTTTTCPIGCRDRRRTW